jgi:guanylate kinase
MNAARGRLVVISAPSGAGKTTIARAVLAAEPRLTFSVSATTRPKRPGEEEGEDYYFLSKEEFQRKVGSGEFVEWEELYGNYYGTLNREVEKAMLQGRHLLFDVDVNGGLSIKERYPEAMMVFIRPPDIETLRRRLAARGTEDAETMKRRMARVQMELEKGKGFDRQVVNDDLARAVAEVVKIVEEYLS